MSKFFDTNYNITKLETDNAGNIVNLEINDKEVDLGSDVSLEDNKEVSITENGEVEIEPSDDYDAMKKVTATVSIPLEDNKISAITSNGTTEITPTDSNVAMKKVTVTTNVSNKMYIWVNGTDGKSFFTAKEKPVTGTDILWYSTTKQVEGDTVQLVTNTATGSSGSSIYFTLTEGDPNVIQLTNTSASSSDIPSGTYTFYTWLNFR